MAFGRKSIVPSLNSVSGKKGGQFQQDREEEILDELMPGHGLTPSNTDMWAKDGKRRVSIERQGHKTLAMQEALDDEITLENMLHGAEGKRKNGLQPCQRVNKEM